MSVFIPQEGGSEYSPCNYGFKSIIIIFQTASNINLHCVLFKFLSVQRIYTHYIIKLT